MTGKNDSSISRRRFLQLAGLAASAGLVQACAPAPSPAPAATAAPAAPAAGAAPPAASAAPPAAAATAVPKSAPAVIGQMQTFVMGIPADPTILDPHATSDSYSQATFYRCYDKLVELKSGKPVPGKPLELEPQLAESWDISPDGLQYTFKLRKGVKFSDGTPLDANAVKWSFDRMIAVNNAAATQVRELKSTEVVDDSTVRMTLNRPFAYFLPTIARHHFPVVNPKLMEKQKDNDLGRDFLSNNVMGSGPYKLADWKRGQQITLEYNPAWWGKEPSIKRVILKVIPESTSMKLQLEKGDIDMMYPISIPETLSLVGKPGVRVEQASGAFMVLAYLNNKKAPFDNVKVRQAMSYAINYDAYLKELIDGKGRRLYGPLCFGMEGYDENFKMYDYNPQKAKQLLAEAGYPNGLEVTLTYASAGAPGADQVAAASQANLADVGITVKIEKVAEPTRRERIEKGEFQWSIGSWTTSPVPPNTMFRMMHSSVAGLNSNRAYYSNAKVDELVSTAPTIMDADKRIAMYRDAQKIIMEESPYIWFYQYDQLIAMRDNFEGFVVKPESSALLNYENIVKK